MGAKDQVICEKGRHVNCLHDKARQAKGPAKPAR
jgi:hypothetical protein